MRVGAIGCGGHATNNVWPQLRDAGLELVATCARHVDRAEKAAAPFGVGAAFDDAAKMLDTVELDGVIVVVPPDQYRSVLELAVERGLPAFCDKPGADSAEEATELARRAGDAGVEIVVGYQKRFGAGYTTAKGLVDSGELGPLSQGALKWSMGPMNMSLRDWLFENPVHHFDLARFFFGELSDIKVNVARQGNEHALVIGANSQSGAVVSLHVNTVGSWMQHNESVEIFGTGHAVVIDNIDTVIHRPPERPERVWRPNYTVPLPFNSSATTMGFGPELEHFRQVVTDGAENRSSIASAAATLSLTKEIAELAGAL
jgi:predicted dehydrogenase